MEEYSTFDLRDGAEYQGRYSRSLVSVPWHWPERSLSGFHDGHDKAMERLIMSCRKDKQDIHAAFFHNFAVSVILKPWGCTNHHA
jgi:hypothetical protein